MGVQRYLLWAALAAGLLAVIAGLAGVTWLASGSGAVLLILFILIPWVRGEKR